MIQRLVQIAIMLAVFLQFGRYFVAPDFNIQPKYQVSIMLEYHPGNPIHICNGAIIYEKLIITTAKCVHFKFGPKGKHELLDPSVLSILAGSTNGYTQALRVNISSIKTPEEFDLTTLENDLALLTLSQSLPLGTRPDIQWIMLDDNVHVNHSCLVNFFLRNTNGAIPNYYQTEELVLSNNEICRNFTDKPSARRNDICSDYILPHRFDCAAADSFLSFNGDRGTGLICNSFLVGLLSEVVTRPDPKNNCSDINLTAMYTNIFPHLMWIYRIMAKIETQYISTPYDSSLNPLVLNSTSYEDNEIVTKVTNSGGVNSLSNTTANDKKWNSEEKNSTTVNTILNPVVTNLTASSPSSWNTTVTNSTEANTTTLSPTVINSTVSWNSTVTNSTPANTTPIPTVKNSTVIITGTWNSIDLSTTISTTTLSPEVTASTDTYTASWNSTAANATTLSPTVSNSIVPWNSTVANSTLTNATTISPTVSQDTALWNSTVTNSTGTNTTSPSPTVSQVTALWNSTVGNSTATNTTSPIPTVSQVTALWNSTVGNSTGTNTTSPSPTVSQVTASWNSTVANSTVTNAITLSPTVSQVTALWNSTAANSTGTNTTSPSPTVSQVTASWNSTVANPTDTNTTSLSPTVSQVTESWNSTVTNSCEENTTLSTTIKNPTKSWSRFSVINSSSIELSSEEMDSDLKANLTTVIHPALNSTSTIRPSPAPPARPYPTYRPYLPSTDSYVKYSTSTALNFPKNSSASDRLSASIILIAVVSLTLIIYH